jgi:hypothetical protein
MLGILSIGFFCLMLMAGCAALAKVVNSRGFTHFSVAVAMFPAAFILSQMTLLGSMSLQEMIRGFSVTADSGNGFLPVPVVSILSGAAITRIGGATLMDVLLYTLALVVAYFFNVVIHHLIDLSRLFKFAYNQSLAIAMEKDGVKLPDGH